MIKLVLQKIENGAKANHKPLNAYFKDIKLHMFA